MPTGWAYRLPTPTAPIDRMGGIINAKNTGFRTFPVPCLPDLQSQTILSMFQGGI